MACFKTPVTKLVYLMCLMCFAQINYYMACTYLGYILHCLIHNVYIYLYQEVSP